ncbi:MAG: cytochrome c3 family protein, partial [Eggerthella lenta]
MTSYPTGSLKAVHIAGQLDDVDEYPNKLCLSCHSRETINAANDDYAGIEGFNPHKAHLAAGDCITCHSVEGTSTLTCNECHDAPLPEGWQSAERGS